MQRIYLNTRSSLTPHLRSETSGKNVSCQSSGSARSGSGWHLNGLLPRLPNTVGVLGGVSTLSTLNFLQKLQLQWSSEDGGGRRGVSLPFVACDDPLLSRQLHAGKRSSAWLSSSRDAIPRLDHDLVVATLRNKRVFLERSGVRCIVMPCHTSLAWYDEVAAGCSVPFFDVRRCVAEELKAAKLKPIEAGSNVRIGVLAMDDMFAAQSYQEILENEGFEVVLADKATMEHTVVPAFEAFSRKDMEGARNLLQIAIQVLLVRAVNMVILASDDMHGLLPGDDSLLKKCINPIDSLVRTTTRWAKSTEESNL